MYVLFEGIDTCGKSTQIARIKASYPEVLVTHEPGATPFGAKAREILLRDTLHSKEAELLLFLADRAEHYERVIKPNREKLILSDRGFLSGIAYAMASGEFGFDTLLQLNRFALQGDLPEKIVLFLIDESTLKQRTQNKSLDGIEARGINYLMRVQHHMVESAEKIGIDTLTIDASKPIETIHEEIVGYLGI